MSTLELPLTESHLTDEAHLGQRDMDADGLPATFDPAAIEAYLDEGLGISSSNRNSVMRVLRKLITGQGVAHTNKSDVFLAGHRVTPRDDLDAILAQAKEWLPPSLDGGNGYALRHPIQKLIYYKNHLLGKDTRKRATAPKRKREDNPVDALRALKGLFDEGTITEADFEAKKADLLARI